MSSTPMRSTLFINTKGPHSSQATRESLDAALASAAFGVPVGLLFLEDGVFQLKQGQQPSTADLKRTAPIFQSLGLYEISDVYVCEEDLHSRGLCQEDLLIDVTLLPASQIAPLLASYDNLLSF
ncbi:sulfurtransferase complex subunit TusC [Ketobacter sp.]|uniref:sulfurtransferase complex subunit TusC n=1 Tax=Ketobacter sp. TaxID=2083498 RepID=UPI000F11534F|nr:sulfurtransferase complex subunit TusC [Ketobacter sp.]RLT97382.1 MAG: sulfurtransferase complex subunit TusC [Ketobacter sp.]